MKQGLLEIEFKSSEPWTLSLRYKRAIESIIKNESLANDITKLEYVKYRTQCIAISHGKAHESIQ